MKFYYIVVITFGMQMQGITVQQLKTILYQDTYPFSYDLGVKIIPGKAKDATVMICCHGYGADNHIGDAVFSTGAVKDHIVSFNFPDYNCVAKQYDPKKSSFGTIHELLPLLYLLKKCIVDGHQEKIDLYGFSAGGAAIINALVALYNDRYDAQLNEVGISKEDKKKISNALGKGIILLDCPLKSIEEIMQMRGSSQEFEILAERYAHNHMRPIDSIKSLKGMPLSMVVYFENPDDILGNRDDHLFLERLKRANAGKTILFKGRYGGHNTHHKILWDHYKDSKNSRCVS